MIIWKCSLLLFAVLQVILAYRDVTSAERVAALPPCATAPGLQRAQMTACRRRPEATAAALRGMAAAAAECRQQFHGQRWNCSVLGGRVHPDAFASDTPTADGRGLGRALPRGGYREVAFARAILTAGIVLEVARECSIGHLSECTCEPRGWRHSWRGNASNTGGNGAFKVHWKWRGCSEALDFGLDFSKEFMDADERADDPSSRVHQHNSNVGRLAVTSMTKLRCKCHGVSGSCSLRTCWQAPPELKLIGTVLKRRFESAVMVTTDNIDGDLVMRPVAGEVPVSRGGASGNIVHHSRSSTGLFRRRRGSPANTVRLDEQLLYIERSPSFCERDVTADVPGTSGRRCRREGVTSPSGRNAMNGDDEEDCSIMCCGRGFDLVRSTHSNCRCRFVWCCKVVCDVCSKKSAVDDVWVAVSIAPVI